MKDIFVSRNFLWNLILETTARELKVLFWNNYFFAKILDLPFEVIFRNQKGLKSFSSRSSKATLNFETQPHRRKKICLICYRQILIRNTATFLTIKGFFTLFEILPGHVWLIKSERHFKVLNFQHFKSFRSVSFYKYICSFRKQKKFTWFST